MSKAAQGRDLPSTLGAFRERVNENTRVHSIIKGWQPEIVVEASDSGLKRYLAVREGRIREVTCESTGVDHTVHLRGTEQTLTAIFDGSSNPAESFLAGDLEIFASDKDQVKLDAISLVLWGV